MYTNHRSPAWALALMKSLVLSLLFLSIVTANTPTTQQTISQPNTNTNNINATSTTYYTEIAIKNTLPVSLKNIRFAHISNQELNVRTWDNVQSGQTLPPVPIKYATGIFSGSDKWNLDITFEDGETFYIDRDSSCNLEESDSGESYTWTIEGVNFDMPMNSDGMNTRISNNDNADEFNDYAFARIKNEYDHPFTWTQLSHTHEGTAEQRSAWPTSIPPQSFSPIVPVYFATGFGNTDTDFWAVRAKYTAGDGAEYLLRQTDEHYKCMLEKGDAGRLFHVGVRGQHGKNGDFIVDLPSGSCTVGLVQGRESVLGEGLEL